MSEHSGDTRALEFMVDELRREPVPDLDWEKLEHGILARLEPTAVTRAQEPHALRAILGVMAVAASVVLSVRFAFEPPRQSAQAEGRRMVDLTSGALLGRGELAAQPGEERTLDLTALKRGDVLETLSEPITLVQEGVVRVTIFPASRVIVRESTLRVGNVIALEKGRVHAEVVPLPHGLGLEDAFAVEVEHTRVAVHGTRFDVHRIAEGVLVEVEEGAVTVGPTGHLGSTVGGLLVGPASAIFSSDGGKQSRFVPRAFPVVQGSVGVASSSETAPLPTPLPSVHSAKGHASRPLKKGSTEKPETAETERAVVVPQNSAAEPSSSLAPQSAIQNVLSSCFAALYGASGDARTTGATMSITSTLRVTLGADGSVRAAQFSPPLAPEFQQCAARIYGRRVEGGPGEVELPVRFSR